MWQALYGRVQHLGFVVIAVALETRGAEAARPWIEAAAPSYPCLIDETHRVADLYGMVNVPIAVWINEEGRIVRPPEPAGTNDAFRQMDHTTYSIPREARASLQDLRRAYVAALEDWAANGDASPFALAPAEVRRRLEPPDPAHALAAVNFRMGEYLHAQGSASKAQGYFAEALRLRPESWAFRRQAWNLEDPAKSGGPEFWSAVDALGAGTYYAPIDMPGLPA